LELFRTEWAASRSNHVTTEENPILCYSIGGLSVRGDEMKYRPFQKDLNPRLPAVTIHFITKVFWLIFVDIIIIIITGEMRKF
jgi:hypothetical protein